MKPATSVTVRDRTAPVVIVDVNGQITLGEGVRTLKQVLTQLAVETSGSIFINMAGATHVDSAGLGLLASSYLVLKQRGGLGLIAVRPNVLETLELTKLSTILHVYPDEAQALGARAAA